MLLRKYIAITCRRPLLPLIFVFKTVRKKMDGSVLLKLVICIDKVIWTRFTVCEY